MKKIISALLAFVLLFQITVLVSAATVVSKDKAPNYDIWLANSFLNGLDNTGEGIYKTFRGYQAPIYQVLGGELLKDKPLVSMSTEWTIFFNNEYRNQFANEQKYIYEVVLMDYLKYGSSVKTAEDDLLGNEFKFAKKLYEVLAKDLENNTIDYIDKELSVDEAVKIWKNEKVITNLDEALEEADDGKTSVKDLIEELSRYSALVEVKESKISLLKASRNVAGDNLDYKKAVDDIVKAIDRTKLHYVRNRSLNYLWNKFLDEGWEQLLDINPVLKAIDLGVSSLDMCFDTSNSASNNLKLAVLYNVDCYMAMGMMKARETYSQHKSASNARIFKECFEGYVQFQMFGNTYADKWLSQYLSGGAIKDLFNQIFHKENIKTAKDMQKLAQSQINTRQRLLEIMNQYAGIYKGKYPIVKKQTSNPLGTVQIRKVDTSRQNQISVEWNRITGANGYQVYTSTSVNGEYKKSATIGAGKTKHTLKVANGKTVYIKIRAFRNSNGSKKYGGFSSPKKGTEIGATWYKKVLKTRSKNYTVRYQSTHIVERKKVNRKDYPYYAVTDLDKDGIKELILHTGYETTHLENDILLMTYKNNKEQPLLGFEGNGFRTHYYLTGKNIAMVTGSSSDSYSVYFAIRDGKLVRVRDFSYWNDKSSRPYQTHFYVNGREVSRNTFQQERTKYFPSTLKEMAFRKIA